MGILKSVLTTIAGSSLSTAATAVRLATAERVTREASEATVRRLIAELRALEDANQRRAETIQDLGSRLHEARNVADTLRKERNAMADEVKSQRFALDSLVTFVRGEQGERAEHETNAWLLARVDAMQADARALDGLRRAHTETARQIRGSLDPQGSYAGASLLSMCKAIGSSTRQFEAAIHARAIKACADIAWKVNDETGNNSVSEAAETIAKRIEALATVTT